MEEASGNLIYITSDVYWIVHSTRVDPDSVKPNHALIRIWKIQGHKSCIPYEIDPVDPDSVSPDNEMDEIYSILVVR